MEKDNFLDVCVCGDEKWTNSMGIRALSTYKSANLLP